MKKYTYHKDGSLLKEDEIFVFGSNLAGIHGAGAALAARIHFGAKLGQGIGLQGQSYAIPTKSKNLNTLPLGEIHEHIREFCRFTREEGKEFKFFVTRVGCGLAGLKDKQIAPFFKESNTNCDFPENWMDYIEFEYF
jgi:hypothetical protein